MRRTVPFLPFILATALFMENIDANVIVTSLPNIAHSLQTNPITLKLGMTSYLIALAIFIPLSGWLADRFTARHVFRAALLIFMLGSLLCALSFSLLTFISARFLQGLGGAMMSPISRLLLLRLTPKKERFTMLTWLTIPAAIGPLIGPPLGGFITSYWSWHWIFLINIPIGFLGIVCATFFLPKHEKTFFRTLDWKGFFLISLGLCLFVIGISILNFVEINKTITWGCLLSGTLLCIFYIFHAKNTENPLLNLKIFQEEIFRKTILGSFLFRLSVGAMSFLLPLMLQLCFHLTPLQSGCITFIGALGVLILKFQSNYLYKKFHLRSLLIFGSLLSMLLTLAIAHSSANISYIFLFMCLFISGFVRALCLSSANSYAFENLAQSDISNATPIFAVLQQISLALSVSIAGLILEWRMGGQENMITIPDFQFTFYSLTCIGAIATYVFYSLPKNTEKENC